MCGQAHVKVTLTEKLHPSVLFFFLIHAQTHTADAPAMITELGSLSTALEYSNGEEKGL